MTNNVALIEEKINKYKNMSMEQIDPNTLKELKDIKLSRKKSSKERILDFLMEIENPYFLKINNHIVQLSFKDDSEISANECLTNVLKDFYK